MTHVATFNDWADAKAHETIGVRQKKGGSTDDVFGFLNPYSAISLSDHFGVHSSVDFGDEGSGKHIVRKIWWNDGDTLPKKYRDYFKRLNRGGLMAEVSFRGGNSELTDFMMDADLRVELKPAEKDKPSINLVFEPGCFWIIGNGKAMIWVRLVDEEDASDIDNSVEYQFQPVDNSEKNGWLVNEELVLSRKSAN